MESISLYRSEDSQTAFKLCGVPKELTNDIDLENCFFVGGVPVGNKEKMSRYLEVAKQHDLAGMQEMAQLPIGPFLYGILAEVKGGPHSYRLFILYAEDGVYGDTCEYVTDIDGLEVEALEKKKSHEEKKMMVEIRKEMKGFSRISLKEFVLYYVLLPALLAFLYVHFFK